MSRWDSDWWGYEPEDEWREECPECGGEGRLGKDEEGEEVWCSVCDGEGVLTSEEQIERYYPELMGGCDDMAYEDRRREERMK